MFASRLPAQLGPTALAKLIADARASGAELLDLTASNPTRAGFSYPEADILAGFQDPRALIYDPDPFGLSNARAQVASLYGIEPDRIVLTTSTSEAYSWLFKLLCGPGDEILVPTPSYPLFEYLAALELVAVRNYPLRYSDGWFTDIHALESAITGRTRAIVVVNPNNPTGSYLKQAEQQAIVEICRFHTIALISDEVFASYSLIHDPERAAPLATAPRNCLAFSLNGLSKMAGLPQMKLGWIVLSGPEPLLGQARVRVEMIADTFLSVGAPVQYALGGLLQAAHVIHAQILDRVRENFRWIADRVTGTSVSLLRAEGGWSATLRVARTRSEEEWVTSLLLNQNVLVQPGYFYDFESEGYLVVSLLTPPLSFREGLGRLLRHVG